MPDCDLCGSTRSERLHRAVSFDVELPREFEFRQCSRCGLIFLHPQPSDTELKQLYSAGYTGFAGGGRLWTWFRTRVLARRARRIQALLPEDGPVLEVGCGIGEFLNALRAQGVTDIRGIDPSAYAVRQARETFGLRVAESSLFDVDGPPGRLAAVIMNHVLEHLPSPPQAAGRVAELLAPGGILFAITPNADSLERRIFGSAWYGWQVPHHPYLYEPKTVTRLLEGAGLRVESISYSWLPNNLSGSVANVLHRRLATSRARRWLSVRNPVLLGISLPFSVILGLLGASGRMEVVARRPH